MKESVVKKPADHRGELTRINRILGQIEGIRRMIESRRDCSDILTQTKAVTRAIKSLEASILEKHFLTCVKETFLKNNSESIEKKIQELISLFKKD